VHTVVEQGTPIVGFPNDVLANKNYTALVGQLGNAADRHETYVEGYGLLGKQMASAVVDASGHMEVGVDGFIHGSGRALSRFALTVKNQGDEPLQLDFAFSFLPGEVLVYDPHRFPATDPRRVESQVFARIDAVLSTPAGPFGGTYDVTEHRLFDFHVGLYGGNFYGGICHVVIDECPGIALDHTPNAAGLLTELFMPAQSSFGYAIEGFSGQVALPDIAPYGELTVYYDMLARVHGHAEGGGWAAIGDPFDLLAGGGIALLPRTPNQVPEPAVAPLLALGVALLALHRGRRRS
jgi:hypothetical protein